MKKVVLAMMLTGVVFLAETALAQTGGVCMLTGSALVDSPGLYLAPTPCASPSGCGSYTFSGSFSGPGCGLLSGPWSAPGKFLGYASCEGNIHTGTFTTKIGAFSYTGTCVGFACSGVGYSTSPPGFIEYDLAFGTDLLTNPGQLIEFAKCANQPPMAGFTGPVNFQGTAAAGHQ
jgi:hypothetical protein